MVRELESMYQPADEKRSTTVKRERLEGSPRKGMREKEVGRRRGRKVPWQGQKEVGFRTRKKKKASFITRCRKGANSVSRMQEPEGTLPASGPQGEKGNVTSKEKGELSH